MLYFNSEISAFSWNLDCVFINMHGKTTIKIILAVLYSVSETDLHAELRFLHCVAQCEGNWLTRRNKLFAMCYTVQVKVAYAQSYLLFIVLCAEVLFTVSSSLGEVVLSLVHCVECRG
jgi:hypothetical protein